MLVEAPGTGTGEIGALGFRTDDGWFRATRVLSGSGSTDSYTAELETTDPAGRTIAVILDTSQGGVISLAAEVKGPALGEVTATGISFAAKGNERYLGFGERSNAVDQRGNVVENYVSDGPWQPDQYSIGEALPPWGFRPRDDATYYPIPWLLSTDGYGVLVDNPETSYFSLDQGGAWSVEVVTAPPGEGAPASSPPPTHLQMRVFAGPDPADVLRRFTKATGARTAPRRRGSLGRGCSRPATSTSSSGSSASSRERTRRCRSRRPISITCRAATSRAGVPRSAPAPRRCTTSASRSRPTSTR